MSATTTTVKMCMAVAAIAFAVAATGSAQAQTQLVIVSGLGGDPKYTAAFAELSTALAQGAQARAGLADSAVTWLGDAAATKSKWYRGPSTRANIETTLARLAEGDASEQLVLILIGHGSGEGNETRVSLPGPDATAADFARMLSRFGDRRVAFINLASASGDMLTLVSSPKRVVVTATKSAFERNESQFGRFFVDALSKDGADTDKDARISLFEAFKYAEAETKRFYENEGRLATEHPQIADQGELARRFYLSPGGSAGSGSNAKLAALHAERTALDGQIESLKKRKPSMAQEAYDQELERLLLALAEKTREIRALEKGGGA